MKFGEVSRCDGIEFMGRIEEFVQEVYELEEMLMDEKGEDIYENYGSVVFKNEVV